MRRLLIAILLMGGPAGCAHMNTPRPAQSPVAHGTEPVMSPDTAFDQGLNAERAGRYGPAVRHYQIAARQGNVRAQMRLSQIYLRDHKGVKRDARASVYWLHQAALRGSPSAQDQLGRSYYLGLGVKKDFGRALQWYRRAADQGYSDAQFRLSEMYYLGRGTQQDLAMAARWYRAGASRGESYGGSFGRYLVGHMYHSGEGVKRNIDAAVRWLDSAINDQVPVAMPAENISGDGSLEAPGSERALAALERQSRNDARLELSGIYQKGEGVPQDGARALRLIQEASDDGSVKATIALAHHYLKGIDVRKDLPTAITLLSEVPGKHQREISATVATAVDEAAALGAKAFRSKRYRAAFHNLQAAANHGNAKAQYLVGSMYFGGDGLPKDYARAIEWWQRAAQKDNLDAITALGNAYWIGIGSRKRNGNEALKHLLYAAQKGSGKARGTIATIVFPGWHYVATFDGHVDLINRRRAQRNGDRTLFWVRSLSAPISIQDGYRLTRYSELLYSANCEHRRLSLKNVIDYTAGGRIIKSYRHPGADIRFALPDSVENIYLDYVCLTDGELTGRP